MLIKQGKTNIKYLLIVIILAAIVGGGIYFWWILNQYELIRPHKITIEQVTITTDKTEYEQGETVKITVKNETDDSICFESCNPYYLEKKNGEWKSDPETTKLCIITTIGECIKPGENKVFEFKTAWESYKKELGTYRVITRLCVNCKDLEDFIKNSETIYSNEFTIKEKTEDETTDWETYDIPGYGSLLDMTLEIDAPFSDAKLTISGLDGSVSYVAAKRYEKEISDKGIFNGQQIKILVDLIEKNNFFLMENRPWGPEDKQDGSTYKITIRTISGDPELAFPGTYSVSCYGFSCSQKFLEIKNKIIEFWGKEILEIGV